MAISFKDRTFCASPNCTNECGRKMTDEEKIILDLFKLKSNDHIVVCYGYFCGEPEDDN